MLNSRDVTAALRNIIGKFSKWTPATFVLNTSLMKFLLMNILLNTCVVILAVQMKVFLSVSTGSAILFLQIFIFCTTKCQKGYCVEYILHVTFIELFLSLKLAN